nr:MAG TPA: hypothetical protein [Caudoviricetes sp.]
MPLSFKAKLHKYFFSRRIKSNFFIRILHFLDTRSVLHFVLRFITRGLKLKCDK